MAKQTPIPSRTDTPAPVVKEVLVPLDRTAAFALFTERIGSWWPLPSHSVGRSDAVACAFEPRVGGRLFETTRDGTEHTWGTVLEWDVPARIALTWHAGAAPDTAQHLEVSFLERDGATLVRLVHSGWDKLGGQALEERTSYDTGWGLVLGRFTGAATKV